MEALSSWSFMESKISTYFVENPPYRGIGWRYRKYQNTPAIVRWPMPEPGSQLVGIIHCIDARTERPWPTFKPEEF
jgi:hypothetical protein